MFGFVLVHVKHFGSDRMALNASYAHKLPSKLCDCDIMYPLDQVLASKFFATLDYHGDKD